MSIPSTITVPGTGSRRFGNLGGSNKYPDYARYDLVRQSGNEVVYRLVPSQETAIWNGPRADDTISVKIITKGAGQGGNDRVIVRCKFTVYDSNNRPYTSSATMTLSVARIMDQTVIGTAYGASGKELIENLFGKIGFMLGQVPVGHKASGTTDAWDSELSNNSTWQSDITNFRFPAV